MKKLKIKIAKWLIAIAKKMDKDINVPMLGSMDAINLPSLTERLYKPRKASCLQQVPRHIIDGVDEKEEMLQTVIRNIKRRLVNEANWEDVIETKVRLSDDETLYLIEASINILMPLNHE